MAGATDDKTVGRVTRGAKASEEEEEVPRRIVTKACALVIRVMVENANSQRVKSWSVYGGLPIVQIMSKKLSRPLNATSSWPFYDTSRVVNSYLFLAV